MDFKTLLEDAWKLTLDNIVPLLLLTLATAVVSFATLGILGPVLGAGYMQALLLMIRSGREPKVQDLFSEMRLFLPLLGFGLLAVIVSSIGFSIFFLPGIIVIFGITYVCLYMIPLMTDRNFALMDAIKESYNMVTGPDLLDHIIVAILFVGISAIGSSVFIGWLFTQPLATIFLLLAYERSMGNVQARPAAEPSPHPAETTSGGFGESTEESELKQKENL